jgi:hypothetical protein
VNLNTAAEEILRHAIAFVAGSPWAKEYQIRLERLQGQLSEPCVLAVAGRVKAGKSTLVNALLGQELALTGATEITATINYFRYGNPDDPDRPVCSVWRNGRKTWETRQFVDSLQGTDEQAIRKASSISRLEFYLPHPDLQGVTLVDTPGTDALADEDGQAHERVAKGFFGTAKPDEATSSERQSLRKRHDEETRQIAEKADAVIYLVGQVAHATNEEFLTEFRRASSGHTKALNAVGVMSKIDIQDEIIEQRRELAAAVADKLNKEINTVVPVSAALWIALESFKKQPDRLTHFKDTLAQIPEKRFRRLLNSDRAYLREYEDCPVSVEQRQALMEGLDWRVFVLLARTLYDHEPDEALRVLEDVSGFKVLRRLIEDHFFKRSKLLRCFRIVSELQGIIDEIQRTRLFTYRRELARMKVELLEFTDFIIAHPEGKSDVANRLRLYLERNVPDDESIKLEVRATALGDQLDEVLIQLEAVNQQFDGLRMLEQAGSAAFSKVEIDELQDLFGLYASARNKSADESVNDVAKRQIYWRQTGPQSRDPMRRKVASLAVLFYGKRLAELQEQGAGK